MAPRSLRRLRPRVSQSAPGPAADRGLLSQHLLRRIGSADARARRQPATARTEAAGETMARPTALSCACLDGRRAALARLAVVAVAVSLGRAAARRSAR